MQSRIPSIYIVSGLWVLLMGVALFTRPMLPVDETRYLAVAWEMWLREDFLVPYLNGETYSHKPPLLFWLMQLGWGLFGVNEWWPRLIAPLFGLASLFLTARLAQQLWPTDTTVRELSPVLLLGCVFWTLFTTLTMFDMMLSFFVLLGLLGIVKARRYGQSHGFVYLAVAVGLGVLTKGPAILLHILPVALLGPYWASRLSDPKPAAYPNHRWYAGVLISVCVGVVMALAWAIPAGMAGGKDYQQAIFWGQAAGRMVDSFAHERAIWWYAAIVPGLLLPWFVWPPLWRGLRACGGQLWRDGNSLFCLIWFLVAFIAFSLISGKQLHYLLPEFPALALVAARALSIYSKQSTISRIDNVIPGLLFGILGLVLLLLSTEGLPVRLPSWNVDVKGYWGLVLMAASLWVCVYRAPETGMAVKNMVLLPVVLVIALHFALAPVLAGRYDLKPLSQLLKTWQDADMALANFGKYHGQFQFLGRLTRPVVLVGQRKDDLADFLTENPTGRIVAYYDAVPDRAKPVAVFPFRDSFMVVWDAETMLAHPGIGNRN